VQSYRGVLIRQTNIGVQVIAREKIKLQGEAVSEILTADTHLESGAEASDVKDYFEEASAEVEP
jgi:hypothetical protein